jgi:hypothetical protein
MDPQPSAPSASETSPAAPGGGTPTGAEGGGGPMGSGGPPGSPSIHSPEEPVPAPAIPQDQPTLAEKVAQLWRQQVDVIAQRIFMDTQALFGVGAIPPDVVILRTIVLNLASALEQGNRASFLYTFGRNSREVSAQINDQTIPYLPGIQLGGHIEGVLRNTVSLGFRADPALRDEAQTLLDEWFSPAYPALLGEPRALVQWQAPRA